MRGRWHVVVTANALLVASAVGGPMAAAQDAGTEPPPPTPLEDTLSGPAKEAYETATVLVNNKDCAHAIPKYWRAYNLANDPRLLFDIAVCERDLRAYAQMQAMLLRYESEAGAALSSDQKVDINRALGAVRRLVGTLHLTVNEAGAEVRVDAEPVGVTPIATALAVDLGHHVISVRKDGFEPAERVFDSAGGDETSVSIELVRRVRPALLRVVSDPDATVVIDRKAVATGSFAGPLAPGPHQVRVFASGKRDYEDRVVLTEGEGQTLHVTLAAERHPPLWPWIAGGTALIVGAAVGGYFLFRTQDTRAVGPQGELFTVQLPPGAQ